MALIELKSASYRYEGAQAPALDSISLTVSTGEYVAVVGANGSGKSTLLRLLDGLRLPSGGKVYVNGLDTADASNSLAARRAVALVFQSPADEIVSSIVEEDVAFGPENLGLERAEIADRVGNSLAAVDLENEARRTSMFLSGGQQQRLAVAGALAMRPDCIAFDEATAMLDPPSRGAILDLIDALVAQKIAIIHVTHSMEEAARAKRIIALDHGRIIYDGSPEEFFCTDGDSRGGEDGAQHITPALAAGLPLPESLAAAGILGLGPRLGETAAALAARALAGAPGPLGFLAGKKPGAHASDSPEKDQSAPAFILEHVNYTYLKDSPGEYSALRDISFALPRASSLAVVGKTGSGKSTLLKLLNGVSFPDEGRVTAFGISTKEANSAEIRALRMRAPLCIQRPESALFETYAGDDVAYGPRNMGIRGHGLVDRVREAMDSVGLPYQEYCERLTRGLSGGEKRRLALAGVLALRPEALILDEPTSALDPKTRAAIDRLIIQGKPEGETLVYATHSMDEAAMADFIAVIKDGRLAAIGSPREIFYERFSPEWGIGRPFAVELAIALQAGGAPIGFPLCLADIKKRAERQEARP